GAVLVWPDGSRPSPICDTDPPRLCGNGNIFGGKVPARTWFDAMGPLHEGLPVMPLPPTEPRYVAGQGPNVPNVVGQGENTAQLTLERAGFRVKRVSTTSSMQAGLVTSETPTTAQPGDEITIMISDGSVQQQATRAPAPEAPDYRPPRPPDQNTEEQPGDFGAQPGDPQGGPDGQPPDNPGPNDRPRRHHHRGG
ncbi:MAG: PASTA domain-containing protein, partial [Pseudonocardiaceae bacterium]